jgi:predicted lipoprotein
MRRLAGRSTEHMRRSSRLIVLILGILLLSGCTIATIRPLDETGKPIIEQKVFSAAEYVDERWESLIIPYARENAVPLEQLIQGLRSDQEVTAERYGVREGTNAFNFLVSGTGTVREVDTSSLMGLLHLELPSIPNAPTISIQIGPVIRGTALRDAVPFIDFDQFTNQIEFANVSNELHKRVREDVLSNFKRDEAVGKTVTFWGAFTLETLDNIRITPVILEVGE